MAEHGFEYAKELGKCIVTAVLWPRFKRHIDYLLCCPENIQGLTDETRLLKRAKLYVDHKKEEARYSAEAVTPDVENWSNEVAQKLEVSNGISQSSNGLKPWDIFGRYTLGKSAKRTAQGILKLRNEADSMMISFPAPPASMRSLISHEPTEKLESRRRVEDNIVEFLNDDGIRMIAICGAGGVGKTTMAQRIEERVRTGGLFDEVVFVVVGQQIDILNIQKEIAEIVGLKLDEDTLPGRAHKIHTRLLDSRRKLLIFDNVWKSFDLEQIGVPFEACKIILTSRSRDLCHDMEADKVVQIDVLDEQEAWRLFREKTGECVDKPELLPIAEAVAAECGGLPIALVTIGKALKYRSIETWRDSLSQLKRANPTNFPQVKNVYEILKLSYDLLENESEKSLFLLCCLFPDGYSIPIELLTLCGIGLGMLEGIMTVDEGRNRTHGLVEKLKNFYLLMNGSGEHDVKMHDVIRDVAIYIGMKERRGFLKSLEVSSMPSWNQDSSSNCEWMSIDISKENAKLPTWSDFPNLRLLMMLNSADSKFPEGFDVNFEGMEELVVLYFSGISLPSLPTNLKLLKNLATLHLEGCAVKNISILGELASLIIVRVHKCEDIEELPADIGRLNRLRVLELISCERLARIVGGVISSLVGLEELKIIHSFDGWEATDDENSENNARLCELESLPNLTSLHIDICKWNLFAQELCLSQQLVRYSIHSRRIRTEREERSISLKVPRDIKVGNWLLQLARSTQLLCLYGNDTSYNFNFAEEPRARKLFNDEEIGEWNQLQIP
ncbi:probable disease resistance protein At4g27220 isoform X2 [Henckelia pumila]